MRTLANKSLPAWLFLLCLLVFARSLMGDFVMDDWPAVKENSKITDSKYIPAYFTSGVWANTDISEQTGAGGHSLYRPLFLLTLNISHQIWGDNTIAYHALNLSLHGINTILVYFLIAGFWTSASRKTAGMAAAIFAVHPVHVESVAWISGISDPLVSLFLLSGFLLHRRSRLLKPDVKLGVKQQAGLLPVIGAPLCYALALLSKETAILFPVLLLIFDVLFHRASLKMPAAILRYAPYAVLLAVYFILRDNALNPALDPALSPALNPDGLAESGAWALMDFNNWPMLLEFSAHYVQLLFFPTPLKYYYTAPDISSLALSMGGIIILGALLYIPRALQQGQKLYVLAVAWASLFLIPVLPIALFSEPVFATRALYLPSAGFALFMAWLVHHTQGLSNVAAVSAKAIVSIMLLWFTVATLVETDDWQNDTIFYTQAIKTSPDSYKPVAGLATAKERAGDSDYAIDLYLRAAALAVQESDQLDFQESAARLYGETGNTNKSEELYKNILQQKPNRSSAWVGLGNNALTRGDSQQALRHYQNAYQTDPNNFVASYNLMMTYQSLGKLQMAARFREISKRLQQTSQ